MPERRVPGALVFPEQTAAGTPASGQVVFYAKADGRFYGKDDAGVEFLLGAPDALGSSMAMGN